MATVAELRARLAKYAQPAPTQPSPQQSTNSEVPNEQCKQEKADSAAEVAAESAVVQRDAGENSVVAGEVSKLLPTVVETVVQTDLQPTTLVVVERPVDTGVGVRVETVSDTERTATNLDVSNPIHQGFLQRLDDLETALLQRDPLMRTHLGMIHKTMIEYEEIANLLTEDEIRKIMTAQQQHTGIILKQELVRESKSKATAKAAKIGLGDI